MPKFDVNDALVYFDRPTAAMQCALRGQGFFQIYHAVNSMIIFRYPENWRRAGTLPILQRLVTLQCEDLVGGFIGATAENTHSVIDDSLIDSLMCVMGRYDTGQLSRSNGLGSTSKSRIIMENY